MTRNQFIKLTKQIQREHFIADAEFAADLADLLEEEYSPFEDADDIDDEDETEEL